MKITARRKMYPTDAWYYYLIPRRLTLRTNPKVLFKWLWFIFEPSKEQYERWLMKKFDQYTFVYCPHCGLELISSHSEMNKDEYDFYVYYNCANCHMLSKWDFSAPAPMLIEAQRIGGID